MKILAIETSMDETGAAVVEGLSNGLVGVAAETKATSEEMHVKTGGVVPEVAAREQLKSIIPVVREVLDGVLIETIDAVAVTVGPGMIGSLLVGAEAAKGLALAWEKPLIPVNHLQGHLFANFISERDKKQATSNKHFSNPKLQSPNKKAPPKFPAVGLVVSGGHTDLVLMRSASEIKLLGSTRDDAAGECFDKCGRLLGLPYPAGPAIETMAGKSEIRNTKYEIRLPRPLIDDDSYEFSFSGLKATVARQMSKKQEEMSNELKTAIAAELQEAIVEVLVAKVIRAVEEFKPKSVLLGGGVAANSALRRSLSVQCSRFNVQLFAPEVKYCTDNAVMVGAAALVQAQGKLVYSESDIALLRADPGLEII